MTKHLYYSLALTVLRILPTLSFGVNSHQSSQKQIMFVNTRLRNINYEKPFTASKETSNDFITNLMENCDKCFHDHVTFNSSINEAFVINDLDFLRISEGGMKESITDLLDSHKASASETLNRLDGQWKLRYSNKKWNTNYRGLPNFFLNVNSSTKTIFHEIDFINNTNNTLQRVTIGLELHSEPVAVETSLKPSFKTKFQYMNYERKRSILPFLKSFSTSWPSKIPFLKSLIKEKVVKTKFPNIISENFEIAHVDDDVLVTVSDEGEHYNVYSRLYQVWDPSVPNGWNLISLV